MHPDPSTEYRAVSGAAFVEAFPNTFLGVLLPATIFNSPTKPRTQPRSDWLYEAVRDQGILHRLLDHLGWTENQTRTLFLEEKNHDLRAALVCLLTAGFASARTATVVGDEIGGWFWLPPLELWADWAVATLDGNLIKARRRGYPDLSCRSASGQQIRE